MKAFEFSLQTLLNVQEALERAAEERLAGALRDLQAAHEKVKGLMSRRNAEVDQIEALKGTRMVRHHYSTHLRFLDRVHQQIAIQSQRAAVLQVRVDELRIELHNVMRERKSLEKLKERELGSWQKEQRRFEQKEMDEFAAASHLLHRGDWPSAEMARLGRNKENER